MFLSPISVWNASDICLIGEQGLGRLASAREEASSSSSETERESNDVAAAVEKVGDKKLHLVRSLFPPDALLRALL